MVTISVRMFFRRALKEVPKLFIISFMMLQLVLLCFVTHVILTSANLMGDEWPPSNYSVLEAPEEPIDVFLDIVVREVSVDDQSQLLRLLITMTVSWVDRRLITSESQAQDGFLTYNSHSSSVLNKIWRPTLFAYGNRETKFPGLYDETTLLGVNHFNGSVNWHLLMQLECYCGMNFENFPFDDHFCPFLVGSFVANESVVVSTV